MDKLVKSSLSKGEVVLCSNQSGGTKFLIGGCYVIAKRKVSKKFRKMSEVYKIFSRQWEHILDYSEESLVEMFNYESHGTEITNRQRNGYYVGKQWLNVHIEMWKEDFEKGYLRKQELYDDPLFPHWWLDSVFKK